MSYYFPLLPGRPKSILRCGHPAHRPKVHPSWRWKTHSKELWVLHSCWEEGCIREAQRVSIVPDTHWPSTAVTFMNTSPFYLVYRFIYHLIWFDFFEFTQYHFPNSLSSFSSLDCYSLTASVIEEKRSPDYCEDECDTGWIRRGIWPSSISML